MSVEARLRSIVWRFSLLRRALRLIWAAAKLWTLLGFALLMLQGLLPAFTVYLTKVLVDSLATAIGAGLSWENARPVLVPAAFMGGVLLLAQVLQGFMGWVRAAQAELVQDHIKALIHEKAAVVDLAFYETPEQSDRMSRANGEAGTRSLSILQNLGSFFQNLLTLVAVAALLIPYGLWLPVLLLVSTLPAFWVVIGHNRIHHSWWERTTEERRWAAYYDQVLTHAIPAAELRLFGLSGYFQGGYAALRRELRNSRLRLMRNQSIAQLGASAVVLVVTAATLAWMAVRALRGAATLGDIALFYQAFNQGQGLMRSLLGSLGQLYADTLFLEHLFTFLDLQPELKSPPNPLPVPSTLEQGITFKNVSFRYPGSEHLALRNFNLSIPAGKTIALVGPNGAGKTTVTKLLCRFYDPDEGTIALDGADLRALDVEALRRQCTVMFQYPMRYIATVGQNIAMSDSQGPPDRKRLEVAAQGGGAHDIITRLPNGYDTLLGKEFRGGVELSGGQWQRVSLARAFYRESPIVMLDEPTSFMDSWAEAEWLERFRNLVKGRTAIIVTHRFTTAMRADVIYVMDEGRIVESGSHEELLDQGGRYATSWNAQVQAGKQVSRELDK